MLGYVPAEFGPVYRFAEQAQISRFRTLLFKWGLMMVLAVLASAMYVAVAHGLGMPIPHGWSLSLYGVCAITVVGITSTSMIAALGSIGLLANILIFVILGLPSAGATVQLEAAPWTMTAIGLVIGAVEAPTTGTPKAAQQTRMGGM
jgi:hypothetical protein